MNWNGRKGWRSELRHYKEVDAEQFGMAAVSNKGTMYRAPDMEKKRWCAEEMGYSAPRKA